MLLAIIYLLNVAFQPTDADYWSNRALLIEKDQNNSIGSHLILNADEQRLNNFLMKYKLDELRIGNLNPGDFPPAQHFFTQKSSITNSKVFQLIQKLPKGASLHSHDAALTSLDYLYSLTYRPNLYALIENNRLKLCFMAKGNSQWKLLNDLRKQNTTFELFLKSQLSIIVDNPSKAYPNINSVWFKFLSTFETVFGLITYKPIFMEYFYQALKELHDDNVLYFEFRGLLPAVYDLTGRIYQEEEVVQMYCDVLKQFKNDYPAFYDAKFIYAPSRRVTNATFGYYVKTMKALHEKHPSFVIGFDLVGQEDVGEPLNAFVPDLLELGRAGIRFFFHAGETNWFGTTDDNLYDAILLNTTRIGHGYALVKHPELLKLVVQRKIGLEIAPISNQVLKLVDDLRNHPGGILMAGGYPVVIVNDDPTFWNASGLSYDWYLAFMGMAKKNCDLRFLKQMALNSLIYTGLDAADKSDLINKWQLQWDQFVLSFNLT